MAYQSKHTGATIDDAIDQVAQLLNIFYPVGSIYTSTKSTSPATLFGGTWVQIKDTFLLTAGDSYSAGSQGGSATHTHTTSGHTLTVAETPAHTHTRGTMNITGKMANVGHTAGITYGIHFNGTDFSGVFQPCNPDAHATYAIQAYSGANGRYNGFDFDASRSWTGATSSVGGGAAHSHGNTGSTSNLPPYKVVYAWERTA